MAAATESWSGRLGFILATVGSAVGLGSIWKFPYEVGANGGSGFLLFYVLGLVLVVVPLMFAEFAIGRRGRGDPATSIAAVAFFVLLFVAALASAISLLELVVAMLVRRRGWTRGRASFAAATTCFAVGIATVLSFNLWSAWYPLTWLSNLGLPGFGHATVFDLLDHLTSNVLLPLTGLLLALFAGWALPERLFAEELGLGARGGRLLRALLRYIVPPAIAAIGLAAVLA